MCYSYCNKEADLVDISLECVSAITNTGFAAVDPTTITTAIEIILMILMYIGRIGQMALVTIFVNDEPVEVTATYNDYYKTYGYYTFGEVVNEKTK